jgi:hypothetical protein
MNQTPTRTLAFQDAGRTFTCTVAPRRASEPLLWWWFSVSDGSAHRYAPFVADQHETDDSVRARIVAYYDDHIARRAAPTGPRFGRPAARTAPADQKPAASEGA